MKTNIKEIDGKYVVALEGRLDTAAADQTDKELSVLNEQPGRDIIFDCEGLEYISSSGLRILLNVRKHATDNQVTIRNLNDDVLHIFQMTGFNNLFNIE
jgi:anti-anti-sigma factor